MTNEEAKAFLDNLKICINEHPIVADWLVEIADRKTEPQTDELREAKILLKASRDLLNKQNETIYVLNLLEETVEYHDVECDGYCLIDDIDDWLALQTEPQTERKE